MLPPKLLAVRKSVTILDEDVDQNRTPMSVWEAIPGSASQVIHRESFKKYIYLFTYLFSVE